MKRISFLSLAVLLLPLPSFSRFIPSSSTSTQAIPISTSKITDNTISAPNSYTYTITTPGHYFLSCPLNYQPQATNPSPPYSGLGNVQPVISIQANNVTLDLGSFVITSDNSDNPTQLCRAIDIGTTSTAVSNIEITNGCIDTMGDNGIYINASCTNITISNLQINDCTQSGINVDTSVTNLTVKNVQITDCATYGVGVSTGATNLTLDGAQINNCSAYGVFFSTSCSNLYINDAQIDTCTLGGIYALSANNIDITNSSVTGSTGNSSNNAMGLYLNSCNFVTVANSSFSQNTSSLANAKDAIGVCLASCNNCVFENCFANQNGCGATTASAYGFKLTSCTACYFKGCQANVSGNFSSSYHALNAFGYYDSAGTDNHFDQCQAFSNTADQTASTAAGFYFSGTTNNECKDCEARDNNATGSAGTAYGFYSTTGTGNVFSKCKAHGSRAGTTSAAEAAGFVLASTEKRSTVEDSVASANNGGSGACYGIKIGQSSGACPTFCLINNNQLMNNFGTTAQYGLKDFSANSTSLITRNQAFGQGQVFRAASGVTDGSFMNFMISYTPTDINLMNNMLVEGDRADLKVFDTAGPLDNLSIYALDNLS